ncbi:MAG: ABC transporter permease [Actinomycetes bacterium]
MSTPMPTAWRIGRGRISLELRQFFRDRESAVFNFALPVLLLIVFGSVFGGQDLGGTDVSFAQYFVAGMIASGILYTSFQNLAISIPIEREDGTLKRLRGTPMPKSSYFMGKVGTVVVAYVAQIIVLITVGRVFYGLAIPTELSAWVTFAWLSALGLIACTLLGIAYSVVPRQGKGASAVVAPVVLVLQFISGVFFIFSDLPTWMQNLASVFPLKWLAQGMRSVFLPESAAALEVSGSFQLPLVALVLSAWCIGGAIAAVVFFRWSPRGTN